MVVTGAPSARTMRNDETGSYRSLPGLMPHHPASEGPSAASATVCICPRQPGARRTAAGGSASGVGLRVAEGALACT